MTYVRNPMGEKLLCCWDDCETAGHDEIRLIQVQDGKAAIYIFCSDAHKAMHSNGHFSYGNLALGDRGLIK
jgi:hypothetical protein